MAAPADTLRLHIGTYAEGGGAGLYPLTLGSEWELGDAYRAAANASFGVYSPRFGLYYLIDERDKGLLRVLRRDDSGWRSLAQVPTCGAQPCYAALSPDQGWLAVANYGSGSVAVFELDPQSGLPAEAAAVRANKGHGRVADRQEGPHAHCAIFAPDGKWLFQTDLGTDEVLAFAFDAAVGLAHTAQVAFAAPAGSGPRHLAFHPFLPMAFLVSELASTLTALEVMGGALSPRQTLSILPGGFEGESLGGHLAINSAGDRVYVTNRGHDSIATFAVDDRGRLALLRHTSSGGTSPRFLLLLEIERRMIVANEEGCSVTIFDLAEDGAPAQSGEVPVPAPVFLFTET